MAKTRCEICDRTFKNEEALEHHNNSKHASATVREKTSTGKPKTKFWVISGIIVIALIILFFSWGSITGAAVGAPGKYDAFAQCLTDSGVKMFGAYWCPHCQDQKASFGKSWKKVNYIECSLPNRAGQTSECNAAGIQSYPTWEFADGSRRTGAIPLEQLSQISGCALISN